MIGRFQNRGTWVALRPGACIAIVIFLATTSCKEPGRDKAGSDQADPDQADSELQGRLATKSKNLISMIGSLFRKDIVVNGVGERKLLCLNSFYRGKGPYLESTVAFYKTYYMISEMADFVSIRASKWTIRKMRAKSAQPMGIFEGLRTLAKSALNSLRISHLKFIPGKEWAYGTYHFPKKGKHNDFLEKAIAQGQILGFNFSKEAIQLPCPDANPASIPGNSIVYPLESMTVKWKSGEEETRHFWPKGEGKIEPYQVEKTYYPPEGIPLIF